MSRRVLVCVSKADQSRYCIYRWSCAQRAAQLQNCPYIVRYISHRLSYSSGSAALEICECVRVMRQASTPVQDSNIAESARERERRDGGTNKGGRGERRNPLRDFVRLILFFRNGFSIRFSRIFGHTAVRLIRIGRNFLFFFFFFFSYRRVRSSSDEMTKMKTYQRYRSDKLGAPITPSEVPFADPPFCHNHGSS